MSDEIISVEVSANVGKDVQDRIVDEIYKAELDRLKPSAIILSPTAYLSLQAHLLDSRQTFYAFNQDFRFMGCPIVIVPGSPVRVALSPKDAPRLAYEAQNRQTAKRES